MYASYFIAELKEIIGTSLSEYSSTVNFLHLLLSSINI